MTRTARPAARTLLSASLALALTASAVASASAGSFAADGRATVSGDLLEVIIETEGQSTTGHVLVDAEGVVTEVEGDALEDIASGAGVRATVEETVDGTQVLAATVIEPLEATVKVANHAAYVVTVNDPLSDDDVSLTDAIADTEAALAYWMRESRGAIPTFAVAGSDTLTLKGSCDRALDVLWTQAAALFPTASFARGRDHLIVYTPEDCDFPYAGVANVGSMATGGYIHIAERGLAVTAHEIGHHLGLGHSNLLWGDGYSSSNYGLAEYYGAYSPMAFAFDGFTPANLDAGYRHLLDLPGADTQTQTLTLTAGDPEPQVATIGAAAAEEGTTAVTFRDDQGLRYFIDYRDGTAEDSEAFFSATNARLAPARGYTAHYAPGVVITAIEPGYIDQYVIGEDDGSGALQTSFGAGDTFVDPMGRFTLDVTAVTADAATVAITAGPRKWSATTATASKAPYGSGGKVTVAVAGKYRSTGKVTLAYRSQSWTRKLDFAGKATFTLPTNWKPGTRTLTASYAGSLASHPSETTVKATVTKATPKVTAVRKSAVTKGSRATLVATVASDVARETGQVQAYVGGKAVSAKVTLVRSGSVYKARFSTWRLPEGRIAIKYYGNALLAQKRAGTGLYAR
ncbi:hypothetical protein [Demequina phytophila]|uniref:hypothetical protein n=1 Tax=Demequina phytophila TaxID=1638981 RepID=UPI00078133D0|nr:hypothetical protein [Demequina phytophila]